jgi:quinol monooxygenase YgiN
MSSAPRTVLAVADMYARSDTREELEAILARFGASAVNEPGCLRYSIAASLADPDHFVLVSQWSDQASLDRHYESPEFAEFQFSLHGLLSRSSEATIYGISDEVRPLASRPMDPRDAD